MNVRRVMVLLIAILALVAAGCGGDSNESAGDAETTVATVETTDDDTMTDDSAAATDDDADDTVELSGKCAEFADISTRIGESLSGDTANLDEAADLFDEIADEVPDEIREDYQVIADNFSKIAEALEGVDLTSGETPSPEALAKLQEVTASMDSAEVQQASENIQAWVEENC